MFSSPAFNPRMIWAEEWERMEQQLLFGLVEDEIWQLLPGWIHRQGQAGISHPSDVGCGAGWLKCHVFRDWFVPKPESMPFQLWMKIHALPAPSQICSSLSLLILGEKVKPEYFS